MSRTGIPRIAVCLTGLLLMLVAVPTWRAPFPYRKDDRAFHGVTSRVDFQLIDAEETERARRNAADAVPLYFDHNPGMLDDLPLLLRNALGEIAQANDETSISERTRRSFGFLTDAGNPLTAPYIAADPSQRLQEMKQVIFGEGGMPMAERQIEDIVDNFSKFIEPLRQNGVIDLAQLPEGKNEPNTRIRVYVADEPGIEPRDVLLPQVQIDKVLNEAGALGSKWASYPFLTAEIRPALSCWLLQEVPTTLVFNPERTRSMQEAVQEAEPDRFDVYRAGDLIVPPGQSIDDERLAILKAEYQAVEAEIGWQSRLGRMGVVFALLIVLAVLMGYYLAANEPQLVGNSSRLSIYLAALVLSAGCAHWLSAFDPWPAYLIPLLGIAMVCALAYNQLLATLTSFALALIYTLATTGRMGDFIVLMSVMVTASIPLARVRKRDRLILVGILAGAVYFVVKLGVGIIESQALVEAFGDAALVAQATRGAAMCLAAGFVVAGSLPFIERRFGIVTDIGLLELSNTSHPLLQELIQRAPGTYNHSIAVSTIAAAAAESVGANGLLVRVGAYFHDIGKMLKPYYFVENVEAGGTSRHEHLAPAMSTLIIIGHVKDGVDLAKQYRLPQQIIDFIEQHHGTTLVEYFYRAAALKIEDEPDHRTDAEESSFRYPGPKPASKETGVLMLADAVESASRALADPTPKRIESLVHEITMRRLLDGQFEESSLSLSEVHQIEQSLVKSLIHIYHGRIKYPEAKTA